MEIIRLTELIYVKIVQNTTYSLSRKVLATTMDASCRVVTL